MSYTLTIREMEGYLHAVVTGKNTRENVAGYLKEILGQCRARNYSRVLIEERLEGPRLGTLDVFEIVSQGSAPAAGVFSAIAFVDVNSEGELMQFAETVAVNRSLPLRLFESVAAAQEWLREMGRGFSGQMK